MKIFSWIVKYVVVPCSSLVGIIYAFDMYVIERAKTVVEPVKVRVEMMVPAIDRIDKRTEKIQDTIQDFLKDKK